MNDETRCLCSDTEVEALLLSMAQVGNFELHPALCLSNAANRVHDENGAKVDTAYYQHKIEGQTLPKETSAFSRVISELRKLSRQFHPLKNEPMMSLFE